MDGEKIVLTRRIDEQWLEGNIDGKVGVFPANYVQIVVDVPKVGLSETEQMISQTNQQHTDANDKCKDMQGKALYNFNADTDQDLPLRCGEIITIVEKVDADWYEARNSSGQVGYCPVNYVELCPGKPKKRLAPKPPIKAVPPSPCVTSDITVKEQTTTVLQPLDPMPTQTLAPVLAPSLTPAPAPILTPMPAPAPTKAPTSALSSAPPVTSTTSDSTALITSPTGSKPKPALKPKPTSPLKEHTTAIHGEGDGISPNIDLNAVHGESDAASPNVDDLFGDTAPTVDPLLPSVFRPGGSTYKHVSFIPKGLSSSNSVDSSKGDTLHRQDAIRSPPQTDLSFFDDAVLQPTTVQSNAESSMLSLPQKTLLDASPLIETSGDILAPLNAAPVIAKTSNFDPLAPKPFTPGAPKGVKSVQGPTVGGSKSTSSDFDPFGTAVPLQSKMLHSVPPPVPSSAPSARPTLETKLRSISQISQDLDDFFGTSDNYTSKVSTLDSIESTPSETLTPQPPTFVPFTQVSAAPPPIPPRQPSPNPFSATSVTDSLKHSNPFAASESSQQSQSAITELQHSSSISSPDQIPYQVVPKWHSKNYSIDSVTSEYSDDGAGYYHGLNFSINPAPVHNEEQGPFSFKLPPPPSSPRRTRLASDERPKSPKYNQKTAVPRPKSKKTSEDGGLLSLSTPPASRRNNINKLKVSEAIESFEWNVGELQRKDTIEDETDMPPPSHAPPSLLIDVDNEVAALTGGSGTVSESSTSAVDDLLGFGIDTFSSSPQTVSSNVAKPSRPAPPAPQKVAMPLSVTMSLPVAMPLSVTMSLPVAMPLSVTMSLPVAMPLSVTMSLPVAMPLSVTMSLPVSMPLSVTMSLPVAMPLSVTMSLPVAMPLSVTMSLPVAMPLSVPCCKAPPAGRPPPPKKLPPGRPAPPKMRPQTILEEDLLGPMRPGSECSAKGIELDILFGNVEKVIDVSERFLETLEENVARQPTENQVAGQCFINYSEELEDIYSHYCRNHDDAIALLEKAKKEEIQRLEQMMKVVSDENCDEVKHQLEACVSEVDILRNEETKLTAELRDLKPDPVADLKKKNEEMRNKVIDELMKTERDYVKDIKLCYDGFIGSLKDQKVTEDDHADKHNLLVAINTMTDVATAINEFKRRKDLVMKYRKSDVDSISNKLGKLSLHSIRKKSQRMNQRLTQMTGLVTQTVDEKFNEEERKFRDLEKTIKIFVKDVNSYLEKLQESTSSQAVVAEDIADYYANQANLDEVAKYSKSQRDLANKLYKNYTLFVQQRVVSPLNSLLIMFQGPHKLIQKRFDKLLDYDSVLHKAEKGSKEKAK
uniref:Flocculation protein FLO11-like n=1 Tax=Saccoglossus kowalevskii TaxID=10224 RepID=A0ABM0MY84_SACKO